MRSDRPAQPVALDTETLWASVRKTGRLVIAHEDTLTGGWGANGRTRLPMMSVLAAIADQTSGLADVPLPFAPIMEQAVVPTAERIKTTIRALCS